MRGGRNKISKLFMLNLEVTSSDPLPKLVYTHLTPFSVNSVYEYKTRENLAIYLHQCFLCPSKCTWIAAIKQIFFATWPGLTVDLVQNYLPNSKETAKGHMRQARKNTCPTANKPMPTISALAVTPPTLISEDTNKIDPTLPQTHKHDVFMTIELATGKIYTDQTGRFPVTSTRGNKYILVAYDYDSNTINAKPLKSCTGPDLLKSYQTIQTLLEQRGLKPCVHFLDNECPNILKAFIHDKQEKYQLVPSHIHRRNAAERAIGTFKDHFISGLACLPKDFPLRLWCYLIPQAVLTLSLLHPSRINSHLSAHAQLHGAFNFNASLLDPPGTAVLIHKKPSQRGTWVFRGIEGW